MSNHRWSAFSGQSPDSPIEVNVRMKKFEHPDEHKELIEKVKLGSQFQMRYRALLEFYGDDLLAYKHKNITSKNVNEFLRIFSAYLTDYLEDQTPSSWKDCHFAFWEELIYAFYPQHMKISTKQKDTTTFLFHLKKFSYWLDQRSGNSSYNIVDQLAKDSIPILTVCERLLNSLYLHLFPNIHHNSWDPIEAIDRLNDNFQNYQEAVTGIFKVSNMSDYILTIDDIDSGQTYQIIDFPVKKIAPNILLDGIIGKKTNEFFWEWHYTIGVYPLQAEKYILLN
ncbi:hypothetical protein [Bacillus sp. FJAT-50079]|uniref:hypothetical protein n=1 Tax=Bacillus sp. FJAT-50079 TaxID=2833577 RepID=UPI001BC96600|nr:hypothetical protein [Bacillus sp. FJAT-50079]MBS4209983.1 hypothetical protein [Bacillus sp. FJAT-50079]